MALLVDGTSRLSQALALHEDVLEYVVALNPHDFQRLRNPLMRRLMPPRITLARLAAMTQRPLGTLLAELHAAAHRPLSPTDLQELANRSTPVDVLDSRRAGEPPAWTQGASTVVDLLESDARLDADPMAAINRALNENPVGTVVWIKHRWEPQPFYDVWAKIGVEHFAAQQGPDEWWIFARKTQSKAERR
jgi:hypothetical protein